MKTFTNFEILLAISWLIGISDGRHYVLIRRVYAGEEGRALMEKDESSRVYGWPLGVSSDLALMDSAPIFRAVVEAKEDENEVINPEIHKSPGLERGRAKARLVEESKDVVASASNEENSSHQNGTEARKIDIHDHEPETAETGSLKNATQETDGDKTSSQDTIESAETVEEESLDLVDIEKIMASHKIRVMGKPHPMVEEYLETQQKKSGEESLVLHVPPKPYQNETLEGADNTPKASQAVPDQVMRIAEWLLNRNP